MITSALLPMKITSLNIVRAILALIATIAALILAYAIATGRPDMIPS